jgi:hypothetical protein
MVRKPLENQPLRIEKLEDNIKMEHDTKIISEDSNGPRSYPMGTW